MEENTAGAITGSPSLRTIREEAARPWLNGTATDSLTYTATTVEGGTLCIMMTTTLRARELRIAERSVLNSRVRMRDEPE